MDNESDHWMKRLQIDLKETLKLSNSLLWSAMLTEKGQNEMTAILKS
jgi:hypothetical protein